VSSVQDVITTALRLLGIYGASEIPDADDLSDGLTIFNGLLDSWNAQHLMVYVIVNRVLPLTSTVGTYTIGTGGTFAYPRPVKIESAGLVRPNGVRQEMSLETSATWAQIPEKTVQGKLPLRLYCDYAYPQAALKVWPIPSQPCSLDLYVWHALTAPMVIGDIVDLPPAYLRGLTYNLAVVFAPEFGKDPGPVITGIAQQSKAEIMALNASMFAGTQDPPAAAAPA
jgi:hypothetical protein